jgi:hypothetical protein
MNTTLNVIDQTNILHIEGIFSNEECIEIAACILKYKTDSALTDNIVITNGVWSGHPHLHNGFPLPLQQLIIFKLKKGLTSYYNSMPVPDNLTTQKYKKVIDWDIMMWAGVSEPGAELREHVHTNSFISATVYFQSTNTGRIEFLPHNYMYRTQLPQWPYHGTVYYEPSDGDMLLFPSFLLHRVERNPANWQRVGISFNAIPLMEQE